MLDLDSPLAMDVRIGMTRYPKRLPPRWLYDETGSRLFDEITRLPEYYPTEAERHILREHAAEIVHLSGATTVVELGSGTSDKTTTLLDAFAAQQSLRAFVPVDVSVEVLNEATHRLRARYPWVDVTPVVADFTESLPIPVGGTRLVAFLGGTLGNFYPDERRLFLEHLARATTSGDYILLGTDIVKSADRLIAAYADEAGVTERFILNVLNVINNELDARFEPGTFQYIPIWDAPNTRMDLRLRSLCDQQVPIPGARVTASFSEGEEIRVEISTKFRITDVAEECAAVGLAPIRTFTDPAGDFALTLVRHA
ncbi:MAG: L-histidine N(alpha)-methyltransferase [Actinomycetales bacterium]|nr:L-histidine N(alpha)-methyltransferase [Actinomycetales bacterium]